MAKEIKIVLEKREDSGSSAARRLRREGLLPGVLSTGGGDSITVQLKRHDFAQMLHHHSSESLILDVEIAGDKAKKVLLQDVQHDPVTGDILHVDMIEISMTDKMKVRIAVKLVGDPIGVTRDGGILDHLSRELEVECLPTDLLENIEVDVSKLAVNDSLLVSDLKVDPRLTVLTALDVAVASVSPPRVEEEPTEEAVAEGKESAEPEVIGEKKDGEAAEDDKKDESGGKDKEKDKSAES